VPSGLGSLGEVCLGAVSPMTRGTHGR
jgi:hypothetical protein